MSQRVQPAPPDGRPDKRWLDAATATINDAYAGTCTTSTRPTNAVVGQHSFDVTLGIPIWLKTVGPPQVWVNASGTAV